MSKIEKMSLKGILSEVDLILRENDIVYFCDNIDVVKEFMHRYKGKRVTAKEIIQFLIENEEYIDKEKLILLIVKNYKDNLEEIKKKKKELFQSIDNDKHSAISKLSELQNQQEIQEKRLKTAMRIGKGIDTVVTFYYYNEEQQKYAVDVIDSKEIIDGKRMSNSKQLKQFDQIDEYFRADYQGQQLGLEYVIQAILLTDLYTLFPNQRFGEDIRRMILENEIIKKNIKTKEELERVKFSEQYTEYLELIDNVNFDGILPDVKEVLKQYINYIDIDELLLICAFRFNEALEYDKIQPNMCLAIKDILQGILENINYSSSYISCDLQRKGDESYEMEHVEYSPKHIQKCINQFTDKGYYITDKIIEDCREDAYNQEINLPQINPECIDIIFSAEDLESLSLLSPENLIYVAKKQKWDSKKVIDLYEQDLITIEDIKNLKYIIDLTDSISFEKLNDYYKKSKKNLDDEELMNNYDKYERLYKEVFYNDKSEEDMQESSNITIENIIENFEGTEYNDAIRDYYNRGIITLQSIAEWSNKDDINQLIWDSNLSQEQRVNILITGLASKEVIEQLYMKMLINKEDLKKLVDNNIIDESEKDNIIENLGIEVAEANSTVSLVIDDKVKKIGNDVYYHGPIGGGGFSHAGKEKIVIDPVIRQKFFELLGAQKAKAIKIDENNPFINYEFYVLPGKDGKMHLNSPIIAERYYEDKDTEEKFATDNATYFFQYGDFMVLSNYAKKDEVVSKKENVVFRSSHTVARDGKKGRWATSVIGNVVRSLLSSDLKEYKSDQQKLIILNKIKDMYSIEQIINILKLEEEIDSGEHLYKIVKDIDEQR